MQWLHTKGEFSPDAMREEPAAAMIRETHAILREAMDAGVADNVIPPAMARKLDGSLFLFSGFKTAQELKEASSLLRRGDGSVKPFSEFLTDVRRIDADYNVHYLEAEYNFAVGSAQMAASWAEVEAEGDRYDLQYRTMGDSHVREEHRALNGVTLPSDDPFWKSYYPPNGWNCRCTVRQVRKGKFPGSDPDDAMRRGDEATSSPKQKIFRFNPGIDKQLFPPKHPYYKLSAEVQKDVKRAIENIIEHASYEIGTPIETPEVARKRRIDEMIAELPDNLTSGEKAAIAEHNIKIEEALGMAKGQPMSVEAADRQSANPKYVPEFIQDPKGNYSDDKGHRFFKNPAYDQATHAPYNYNCQTCAPAYSLRLQGFDVTAKPNTPGSKLEYLSRGMNTWEVWKNADGTPAKHHSMNAWLDAKGYKQLTPKRYLEFFDEICKETGVYELSIGWKRGSGHATILQRFPDGELRYIEPQADNSTNSGYEWKDLTYLAENGATKRVHDCRGIMRIDNKLFNIDFIDIFDK